MGQRGSGTRKCTPFYVALMICFSVSSCSSPQGQLTKVVPPRDEVRENLTRGQKVLAWRNYENALFEFQTVLAMSGDNPPGDEALFYIGQVYSDPQNPGKDFSKSMASFARLTKEYPQSTWVYLARVAMENLREQDRLRRLMVESLQGNERLTRLRDDALQESERLKRLSNESTRENLKLKKIVDECSQENLRVKKLVEESKTIDLQIDEKKRGQAK